MEAWRQRRAGEKRQRLEQNETRIHLTPTGLLMEGGYCRGDFERNRDATSFDLLNFSIGVLSSVTPSV